MPQQNDSAKPDKKTISNPFVVEVEPPFAEAPERQTSDKPKEVVRPEPPLVKLVTKPEPVVIKSPEPSTQKKIEKILGTPSKKKKRSWGMFFAGMMTLLALEAAVGGVLWRMKNGEIALKPGSELASPTSEPTVQPTPMPTPNLAATLARDSIEVDVLNASGVKGEANRIASQIQVLGYQKGTTGNATSQTGSTVSFSEDIASLSAVILEDLDSVVDGITVSDDTLQGSGVIQVVIGK